MTLRQAVRVLEDEGLVQQRAGKDTVVTAGLPGYRLDSLRGLADDLREQGFEVSTELLSASRRQPPSWVAEHLGSEPAVRLERLRLISGRPAVHQVSWVPEPYGSDVRDDESAVDGLYEALAARGVVADRASEVIRPDVLTDRLAMFLGRPAGAAALVCDRVTYDLTGSVVVVDRAVIAGDAMQVRAERSRQGISMSWRRKG
jgi:GntR family transcriptional regulator